MKALCILALLLAATTVHAQAACPPGTIPYGTGNDPSACGPDPSQQQGAPTQQRIPQSPPQIWVDHYGAIATDPIKSVLGVAVDQISRNQAQQAAIADCQNKGGTACKLDIAYLNGCTAMVVGKTGYNTKAGATINDAVQAAMKVCDAATSNCHVYYTACSLPQRIQ